MAPRRDARGVAVEALLRIDGGAYANIVLPHLLERSGLSPLDRRFATELVYGVTRMRRACDWLIDRYLMHEPDTATRAALRLGAYQLEFLRTPPHAAVGATVAICPPRTKGLANAVLRRISDAGHPADPGSAQPWPTEAVRLSYPDWIFERLTTDLGPEPARGAMETMDEAATVTTRDDGYVQDRASQWVAAAVGAQPGERILDVCAAPGGKSTAMASAGAALVVAADVRAPRAGLIASNAARLDALSVVPMIADGTAPPFRDGTFDRVIVDAPCSGLGALRRRPDARWRIGPDDVDDLVALQQRLLDASATLVRPHGILVYSVCTLTAAETVGIDGWLADHHPELRPQPPPAEPWAPLGRGAILLPQAAGTDGMYLLVLRRS